MEKSHEADFLWFMDIKWESSNTFTKVAKPGVTLKVQF